MSHKPLAAQLVNAIDAMDPYSNFSLSSSVATTTAASNSFCISIEISYKTIFWKKLSLHDVLGCKGFTIVFMIIFKIIFRIIKTLLFCYWNIYYGKSKYIIFKTAQCLMEENVGWKCSKYVQLGSVTQTDPAGLCSPPTGPTGLCFPPTDPARICFGFVCFSAQLAMTSP